MLEILSVVYREINYQNMKRSPQISQEKIVKIIRRFTLRGQVAKTFFIATALVRCYLHWHSSAAA